MATTMKLIAKQTLGSSAATVTFNNIPSTGYTDLFLAISARSDRATFVIDGMYPRFNGDTTAANYSTRRLYGSGSSAASDTTRDGVLFMTSAGATANTFGSSTLYIPNAFGSSAKSMSADVVSEHNGTEAYAGATAALWTGTAAISSIVLYSETGSNFLSGSSFTLFGISKA
jgi:hypothetical protein